MCIGISPSCLRRGAAIVAIFAVLPTTGARAQENPGERLSGPGAREIAPHLSEALGAVYAGAEVCGQRAVADAVAERHRRHLDVIGARMRELDPVALRRVFDETVEAFRTERAANCIDSERPAIEDGVSGLFGSVDAFEAAIGSTD